MDSLKSFKEVEHTVGDVIEVEGYRIVIQAVEGDTVTLKIYHEGDDPSSGVSQTQTVTLSSPTFH